MLEPIALKGARWVLRGREGSNALLLPDLLRARTMQKIDPRHSDPRPGQNGGTMVCEMRLEKLWVNTL